MSKERVKRNSRNRGFDGDAIETVQLCTCLTELWSVSLRLIVVARSAWRKKCRGTQQRINVVCTFEALAEEMYILACFLILIGCCHEADNLASYELEVLPFGISVVGAQELLELDAAVHPLFIIGLCRVVDGLIVSSHIEVLVEQPVAADVPMQCSASLRKRRQVAGLDLGEDAVEELVGELEEGRHARHGVSRIGAVRWMSTQVWEGCCDATKGRTGSGMDFGLGLCISSHVMSCSAAECLSALCYLRR